MHTLLENYVDTYWFLSFKQNMNFQSFCQITVLTFFLNNKQGLRLEQDAYTHVYESIITKTLRRIKQSIVLNAAAQCGVFLVCYEGGKDGCHVES